MVDLVWTEVTEAKTAPHGPEVGVAHIFVPGQYMTKIENLTRAKFGSLKAYNYKLDKKNPFLQVRTGKANNSISNDIVNWVNQNRSQVYYENPDLSTGHSASEQGYKADDKKEEKKEEKDNSLYIIVGIGVAMLILLLFLFKKK